jgi:type I restriction enzyme S subunit
LNNVDINAYVTGAAQPKLSQKNLKEITVNTPPFQVQQQIVKILSAYDDLIENNLRRIKLLNEKAHLIFKEYFSIDKKNIPKDWSLKKIGDIIDVGRGSSPRPIADQKYFDGGSIPWLKIADATASFIFIHKTKEHVNDFGASFSRRLPVGSLIVAASGTLGFPMFLNVEACIHDGWIYFHGIEEDMKEYFYYSFLQLREHFESISYGAAIQNINTGIVREAQILVPPHQILSEFNSIVKPIFLLIINLQKQNIKLSEARDILLPRLMNGEIEV